jgi:hypothetical protein
LQIYEYLRANTDVRVVYPYRELMDDKEKIKENIWYKTDTHWNYLGGYIGTCALMKELGVDMQPIYSDDITVKDCGEVTGDLAEMLRLGRMFGFTDHEYIVEGFELPDSKTTVGEDTGIEYYHTTNADPRTIYVIKDSFSGMMSEYIGSRFTNSYLRHVISYTSEELEAYDPDIVVYETVERYAAGLGTFSVR